MVHGEVTFPASSIDDQVLLKSDGFPTYHLGVVVDDHLMEINPIIRADEWVSSVPKHILLYRAFGWEIPDMIHVPMVLGPDRKKLSKRHGATSVVAFRDEGYLPEAMVNFLALLGWAYDDKTEIFGREELIRLFTLEKLGHTPGIFSYEKLAWMNAEYIRRMPPAGTGRSLRCLMWRRRWGRSTRTAAGAWALIMPAIQERVKRLNEVAPAVDFMFARELTYDPALLVGKGADAAAARSRTGGGHLRPFRDRGLGRTLHRRGAARPGRADLEQKPAQVFGTLRVAVTGRTVTPPLFETMAALGRDTSLERLERARKMLG